MALSRAETWLYSIAPGDTIELELPRFLILKNASLQAKVVDPEDRTSLELTYTPAGSDIPKSTILATFYKNRMDSVKLDLTLHPGRQYTLTVIGKNHVDVIGDLPEHDARTSHLGAEVSTTSSPVRTNPAPSAVPKRRLESKPAGAHDKNDGSQAGVGAVKKSKGKAAAGRQQTLQKTESTGSVTRARAKSAAKAKPSSDATNGPSDGGAVGSKRSAVVSEAGAKKRKLDTPPSEVPTTMKQQSGTRTKVVI
ncbi:hypothetical protein EST38_g4660 [Candolleomyces aberdarensis]|uniref:Nucleoplasmin-like domain-containing protein n=1 Tax=Candolleomyces aberdarensis TaxID=2316362 RepID=A0A4Q2DMK8_9AGAR|nr:hypothetical protein EST38_g4660 [Candolleomyces aberdarensis]